jgi:hypothetical protein
MKRVNESWFGIGLVLSLCILAGCYADRRAEGADTSTSWLRECADVNDCDTGSDCVAGWCTEPGTQELPAQGMSTGASTNDDSMDDDPTDDDSPDDDPTNAAAGTMPAFFYEADVALDQGVAVGWTGERFLVSWMTHRVETGEDHTLHLAHVAMNGEVEEHTAPYSMSWPTQVELIPTAEGGVAVTNSGSSCSLEMFGAQLVPQFTMMFPCSGDGAELVASRVPSSPDLLFAYKTGSFDESDQFQGSVTGGRCNGLTGEWMWTSDAGPLALNDKIGVFADGDDAVVVWGNGAGTTLERASALAGPDPANAQDWSGSLALDAPTHFDSGYGLASLDDSALLFSMDGSQLRAHVLAPDAEPVLHDVAPSTISDRTPGVAAAPELGLAGVCYARGPGPHIGAEHNAEPDVAKDSMWFVLVGADGAPVSAPVMLADELEDNTGCGVAWSGERFFVVTYGITQEVVEDQYTLTKIKGVLLDPAEL